MSAITPDQEWKKGSAELLVLSCWTISLAMAMTLPS